jgi:O-antigen biosynthesis protein
MSQAATPVFSVVVTSYNTGKILTETTDSVERQTLRMIRPVEMILIDDASTDTSTRQILDKLDYSDWNVHRQSENGGASRARNTGLDLAQGEFILFVDGDDLIVPDYLERALKQFESSPETGVVSGWLQTFGTENWAWRPGEFTLQDLLSGNRLHMSSCFRRAIRARFEESMAAYEDWDFWIQVAREGWKFRFLPQTVLHYRRGNTSLSQRERRNRRELFKKLITNHEDLFREHMVDTLADMHSVIVDYRVKAQRNQGAPTLRDWFKGTLPGRKAAGLRARLRKRFSR